MSECERERRGKFRASVIAHALTLALNLVEATMPESNEIIKDLAKIQHVKFL
jgi:hypothetical protein